MWRVSSMNVRCDKLVYNDLTIGFRLTFKFEGSLKRVLDVSPDVFAQLGISGQVKITNCILCSYKDGVYFTDDEVGVVEVNSVKEFNMYKNAFKCFSEELEEGYKRNNFISSEMIKEFLSKFGGWFKKDSNLAEAISDVCSVFNTYSKCMVCDHKLIGTRDEVGYIGISSVFKEVNDMHLFSNAIREEIKRIGEKYNLEVVLDSNNRGESVLCSICIEGCVNTV